MKKEREREQERQSERDTRYIVSARETKTDTRREL